MGRECMGAVDSSPGVGGPDLQRPRPVSLVSRCLRALSHREASSLREKHRVRGTGVSGVPVHGAGKILCLREIAGALCRDVSRENTGGF